MTPPDDQQSAVEAALAADREAALRDVFATAALGGILNENGAYHDDWMRQHQCQLAYRYADAMMEARKR